MMDNRAFAGLLRRACRISAENQAVSAEITEAFRERYGVTHSDVDADQIIDVIDYGGGMINVAEVDQIMSDAGHPYGSGEEE